MLSKTSVVLEVCGEVDTGKGATHVPSLADAVLQTAQMCVRGATNL